MFSRISDSEQRHNDYEHTCVKRIKQNNAMAVKLGIKGLKSSLGAMQCKRSPPTDSCLEYEIHENIKSSQIIYGMHCRFNSESVSL